MSITSNIPGPEVFKDIVENMPCCALLIDAQHKIVYANQNILHYFGYNRRAIPGKKIGKLISEANAEEVSKRIEDLFRSKDKSMILNDSLEALKARRVDGSEFAAEISLIKLKDKKEDYCCLMIRDITRQAKMENYLQNVISIDPITNLLNHRSFEERVRREHEREQRKDRKYGIFMMDIYKLAKINKKYGHDTGDKAIRIFSDYCRNFFRKSDVIGRWGDDEFIAFLPEVSTENAQSIADRLVRSVKGITFKDAKGDKDVEMAVNIGICLSTPVNSYQSVILQATDNMMEAKKIAPNEVVMKEYEKKGQ